MLQERQEGRHLPRPHASASARSTTSRGCSRSPSRRTTAKSKRFYVYFNNRNCVQADDRLQHRDRRVPRQGPRSDARPARHPAQGDGDHPPGRAEPQRRHGDLRPRRQALDRAPATAAPATTSFDNASRTSSLLGKLLRINPRRDGHEPLHDPQGQPVPPAASPAGARSGRAGLRNPFRFSFDPNTGALIDRRRRPELDRGGRLREPRRRPRQQLRLARPRGRHRRPAPRSHGPGHADRTGRHLHPRRRALRGHRWVVARDPRLQGTLDPSQGRYLYADFCAGPLESFRTNDGDPPSVRRRAQRRPRDRPPGLVRRGRREADLRHLSRRHPVPA